MGPRFNGEIVFGQKFTLEHLQLEIWQNHAK